MTVICLVADIYTVSVYYDFNQMAVHYLSGIIKSLAFTLTAIKLSAAVRQASFGPLGDTSY